MKSSRRIFVATAATAAFTFAAGISYAAWTTTNSGAGTAGADKLATPAVTASTALTSSGGTVNWTAPGTWQRTATYTATASASGHTSKSCSAAASTGACSVSGLDAGTAYAIAVVGSLNNWTSRAGSGTLTTTVAAASLTPSTLTLSNGGGGTIGKINSGDSFSVTFSAAVRPSSVCSSFSDSSNTTQTLGGPSGGNGDFTLRLKDNAAAPATTNDQITVTATPSCGGTLNLGTLDLGSANWTGSSQTFSGTGSNATTVAISGDHKTVTVTLGSGTTTPATAISSATAQFTPSSSIKDDATNSVGATGSASTTTRM